MSDHSHHHIYDFFLKKEINLIYLSVFLLTIAKSLISIFIPIYLYKLNYTITKIIFFYLLVSLFFVLGSLFTSKIVSKIGVKHSMLVSIPFLILYYLGLNFYLKKLFYLLPLALAISNMFYYFGFHLNYISHSNKKSRGKELSTLGIISILATILSPLISGFLISYFSFQLVFFISSILLFLSILPLFLTKDSYEKSDISYKNILKYLLNKRNFRNFLSFTGYATETSIGRIIWPIFLIIIFPKIEVVGSLVTASLLLSILIYYFIGRITDKKDKIKLIRVATGFYFFAWVGRIFANTSFKVLLIDSYKNLAEKVLRVPWAAKSYDIAMKDRYFYFIVCREIIFNLSRVLILPIIMLIFYINFHPFIISFIIASLFVLFYPLLKE